MHTVVIVPSNAPAPDGLMKALSLKGFGAIVVDDAAMAMAHVVSGQPTALIVVEPSKQAAADPLVAAVLSSVAGVHCWAYQAQAAPASHYPAGLSDYVIASPSPSPQPNQAHATPPNSADLEGVSTAMPTHDEAWHASPPPAPPSAEDLRGLSRQREGVLVTEEELAMLLGPTPDESAQQDVP